MVVNAPNGSRRTTAPKKKAGVWDKVASAAVDAGAIRSPPPPSLPIQSSTPWSGSTSSRQQPVESEHLFPALPSSSGSSRRADINAYLKKPNSNAWAGDNYSTNTTETEDSDTSTSNRKKKGKKGKQVLFRVGL